MGEFIPGFDLGTPEARITKIGRWTYSVIVTEGIVGIYYGHHLGRKRAEAKARREIAKPERRNARETWTLT